jgi:hypothetical protein
MSRDISSDLIETLSDDVIHPFFAIELFFDTSTLRFWSGVGELDFGDNTYTGSGNMIAVSAIDETSDISAQGARLTLSGLPSEMISLAINEPYQGRKCFIYFGTLDVTGDRLTQQNGHLILNQDNSAILGEGDFRDTITQIFSGYIDQMNIDEGPETSQISVTVESRLIDLQRPRNRRYTDANQKSRFPNDKGFEFVESLQQKKFAWGR